ncbi:MAG: serine/threonine protein kinase [Cyanobacteria bacterium HKST-UBA02]|nr:serine/threonine protein kinase [Cyanobacteria bacterium HKST-UBA02]
MNADSEPLEALGSRYLLIEKLSEGGMGTVYKVKDKSLDKNFALKLMKSDLWSDKQLLRFQREARLAGRLRHQGIAEIYDFGIDSNHSPYMILELIDGQDLKSILSRRELTTDETIEILIQVAEALDHAHQNDLVHRDIKPANIMVCDRDNELSVKIIDFGIARILDESDREQGLTTTNALIGSPSYMSPEQARGLPVDNRSDLYSLGCVFFESLTGKKPFQADSTLELIRMHAEDAPPALQDFLPDEPLTKNLQAILDRLLAKDPGARYQSAAELVTYLEQLRTQPGESPAQEVQVADDQQTAAELPASVRRTIIIAGTAALILSAIAILSIYSRVSKDKPVKESTITVFDMWSGAPETVDGVMQKGDIQLTVPNIRQQVASSKHRRLNVNRLGMSRNAWKDLPSLGARELSFESCNLTRSQLETLSRCKTIKVLKIKFCPALENDENLAFLKDMTSLKSLDLSENGFTGEGLRYVKGLPVLEQINLHNCPNLTASGLKHLASCPSLIIFELKHTGLSEESFKAALLTPRLQKIELSHCSFPAGFCHLFKESPCARTLHTLSLKHTDISDADLEEVGKLPALVNLDVQDCPNLSEAELEKFQREHQLVFRHGQTDEITFD